MCVVMAVKYNYLKKLKLQDALAFGKEVCGVLAARTIGRISMLLIMILSARYFSTTEYAVWAVAISLTQISVMAGALGSDVIATPDLIAARRKSVTRSRDVVFNVLRRAKIGSAAACVGSYVTCFYVAQATFVASVFVGLSCFVLTYGTIFCAFLRASGYVVRSVFIFDAVRLMGVGLFLIISAYIFPTSILFKNLFILLIASLTSVVLLWRNLPSLLRSFSLAKVNPGTSLHATFSSRCNFTLANIVGSTLLVQLGVLISRWLIGDNGAATFAYTSQLPLVVTFVLASLSSSVSYRISSSRADPNKMAKLLRVYSFTGFLAAVLSALGILVYGHEFLAFISGGADLLNVKALYILLAAQVLSAGLGPAGLVLCVLGHEKSAAMHAISGLCVFSVLAIVLTPSYAVEGLAVAVAVGIVVSKFGMYMSVLRNVHIHPGVI